MEDMVVQKDGLQAGEIRGNENLLKKGNVVILISCFMLGVLADVLFFEKPFGISYPIFVMAFYAVFFWNTKELISFKLNFAWLLTIPVLLLSLTYFIFSNEVFGFLNFIGIPILIVIQTTLLTQNNYYPWYTARFLNDILYSFFCRSFAYIFKPFSILAAWVRKNTHPGKHVVLKKILAGVLISIPLALVVISLLASADQVFEHFMNKLPDLFSTLNLDEFIPHVILICFVTVVFFSYLWSQVNRKNIRKDKVQTSEIQVKDVWDPIIVITVLLTVNVIYVLFALIQFTYLFGSLNYALPPDFTHAEYARRGFFELNIVTLINLTLLLSNINLTKTIGTVSDKVMRILNSLLVLCTFVMLVSAHLRMSLYEETYGYTYLRILTHAFMVFIFVLLVTALIKVWYGKLPLLKTYIVIAILSYTIVNYINIDVVIAQKNIERYHKIQDIDVPYLAGLSCDAIPYLTELVNDENTKVAQEVQNYLFQRKNNLSKERYWPSFNLSKYRARGELAKYKLTYRPMEGEN